MGKSESQMDIMEKSTKPRKHRWTVVEIGLSVIVLLMSCALAGLIVLYTSADRNISARLLQNMDPSVEPCQDFYQYACGGWIERHVIPETSSLHSVFNILRDELEIVLKGVLEMESKDDREAFKKAKTLYSSCMNESEYALLGSTYTLYYIVEVREAYLEFMVSIARIAREDRNLTQDEERLWEDMTQVLELETDIANVTQYGIFNGIQFYFYTSSPSGFNWTRYVQGIMSSVSVTVQPDEPIVVYCSPYLEKLRDVLSKHSHRTLQNYLAWMLIMERVSSMSRRFKDMRAHYRKALHGTTVEEVRWRDCVRYVQGNMENAVGALYVRETFSGNSKRMVRELIKKIQEAYVETLEELSWMDEQSKEKAREKAMAISEQIGYPDHILEEENKKLDEEYTHLNFSEENYFENILENLAASAQKGHKKLREPVDPDMWIIGAAVVNAFYSHNRNQIVFPAGILQPPFFSEKQLQALNFGGIGMVIGHEITHGFDDQGRNFDKDGNMYNWWSNFSAERFEDQSKCMVEQYGKFSWKLAGGQNVSGITTLGENIADNGGVRQAYKAYMKWVEREGEEPRLPGLEMDHKQLFFLNFAQVWCGACRPEYAIQSIKTDPHSPLEYRVLGSLQNFEAFSEAFHCARGTPMNPEEKCRVW
uniref:Membrane metallo-endopeptidase-like 1 n=1 Tax=Cyprinus carpio carpio TaxID=630221 RepID=A0A9J7Z0Q2_CYPCA